MSRALARVARAATIARTLLDAELASRRTLKGPARNLALSWYRIQRSRLEGIAREAQLPVGTVIAAAATLSPATSWGALVADLPAFLESALAGVVVPPFATYGRQRAVAADIVRARAGIDACTGPKVAAFARALDGDTSAVVVDRHAARIALREPDILGINLGTLRTIQDGYTLAARALGMAPRDLQALLWVARVGMSGSAPGMPDAPEVAAA